MAKKDKIIIAIIIVIVVIVVGFISINKHRIAKNECIKECRYTSVYIFSDSGEMVWKFDNRNFKTREECLDYCMVVK